MYPKILRKGTIIQVGAMNPDVSETAKELIFRLTNAVDLDVNGEGYSGMCDVVLDTNNKWRTPRVNHQINLRYDKILEDIGNKHIKNVLERFDDE